MANITTAGLQNLKNKTKQKFGNLLPDELLDIYVSAFVESGNDRQQAITAVRTSNAYQSFYPGNLNPDGVTTKYTESEYSQLIDGYKRKFEALGINADVIDVQSLIPLDSTNIIGASVEKTNRLLIVDEDVPGGGTAYILSQLLEKQDIYPHLDSQPSLLTAKDHRPAYGTDGDYFSKPSKEDIVEAAYTIVHEANPNKYPAL